MTQKQFFDILRDIEPDLPEKIQQRMDDLMEPGIFDTALEIYTRYKFRGVSFLKSCFVWQWTPEGHDYWLNIEEEINNKL